jgi:hypothetical protein
LVGVIRRYVKHNFNVAATCVAKILADIYVALTTGVMATKRLGSHPRRDSNTDKAYQTHLLPRSLVAYTTNYSRYVDDVACTCCATRKALNVARRPEQQ